MSELTIRLYEESQDNIDSLYYQSASEIDRLKAELEYTKEMSNAFMDERNNLKIQLAEARAESKRLSAVVVEIANSGFGMNGNTPCTACEYNVNLCQKGLEG